MAILKQYNVDCYIGVQLLCCFKFRDRFKLGYDKGKYSFFMSHFTPHEKVLFQPLFNKLQREIDLYNHWELIMEYCLLIPKEYRSDALKNCREIMNSYAPLHPEDKRILQFIESKLDNTINAPIEVVY